jgi:hypothetical protein
MTQTTGRMLSTARTYLRYECADTGIAFDHYIASLPEEDWVDLADPDFMKNFAIQAAPAAGSTFTWGWVRGATLGTWRDAGIVQASVPLDGGGNVYTKSAAATAISALIISRLSLVWQTQTCWKD